MAYFLRYNLEFVNNLGDTCLLQLYKDDTEVLADYIEGSSNPVVLRGTDNDGSLYTPIRGQELTAEIVSDTLSITTFTADLETTWKGIFTVNGETVFIGFLLQEDSSEEFVSYKKVIRLKFTDGIGLLKGVELTDSSDDYWHSIVTVYSIVKTCLNKTGLSLPINIFCNIFPADTVDVTDESTFSISKIYTKTFMKNQRDFEDCYEVLRKIMLSFGATLYQYRGEWVIDRWADRIEQGTSYFSYDIGDTVTLVSNSYEYCGIGEVQGIKEVEQPLLLSIRRASKENKLTYNFDQWPELIRNLDLDEGAINFPLSGVSQRTYELDYFTEVNRTAYWRKEIDSLGNETQRYMYIEGAADNLDLTDYVQSSTFPAQLGDKINFSFSASSKTDITTTAAIVYVKCGSYYLDDDGTWSTSATFLRLDWAAAEDTTVWKEYSVESEEIKADGDLEIRFLLMQGCAVSNETKYKNINLEYINLINNSTARGDFNNYTTTVTKNPINETIYVSDSLKKIFKGAIFKNNGTTLESGWQRGATVESYRFTQLNALGYYQSTYRTKYKIEGTFRGTHFDTSLLLAAPYPVGYWPVFTFDDIANKKFSLVSYEIDWFTGIWTGSFVEVNDSVIDVDITDVPATFVYNFIFE